MQSMKNATQQLNKPEWPRGAKSKIGGGGTLKFSSAQPGHAAQSHKHIL